MPTSMLERPLADPLERERVEDGLIVKSPVMASLSETPAPRRKRISPESEREPEERVAKLAGAEGARIAPAARDRPPETVPAPPSVRPETTFQPPG